MAKKQRLDKAIAMQGSLSRSEVKTLIRKGAVTVNGQVVKNADFGVDFDNDTVAVQGKELSLSMHIYLMLNKPKGVVSASEDKKLPTVVDLVPKELWRKGLFPAGRLDKDTTGFVLITDDGEFAHDILSPKKHISKTYHALVNGTITDEMVEGFAKGVTIGEDFTLPASLKKISSEEQGDWGEVILKEGMYHQIKRMFGAYGLKVLELKRVQMGKLPLDPNLEEGKCREMTAEELRLVSTRDESTEE
ncbi:pseudouridine synthase [Negativibacillus massiliensis]|uniref:pseudouridine synthase n=1 Tax=Negativibacillus massiliensis TaxID=1871035 RepID=UPI003AF20588